MRTLPGSCSLAWVGAALLGLSAMGCASSSISDDVARVRALTNAPQLARVVDTRVDRQLERSLARELATPLDTERAVRVALLGNRELRARLRELGVPRGQLLQAQLLPNPRVEAELLPERGSHYELRVEYDLTRALLAPLRAHGLEPELESARYGVAAAVVDLGYRVRVGFLQLRAAEQRLGVARQALLAQQAAEEAARAMLNAGNVTALDLATQESASQAAQIVVSRLELEHDTQRERFARLLGVTTPAALTLATTPLRTAPAQPFLPDDLERKTLGANLDLKAAREHLEALARQAGYARTEGWLPDISMDVHALGGGTEGSHANELRFGGGVNIGLPLFDRQQGRALALDASLEAGLERYYGAAAELRSELRELSAQIRSAHARARKYQEELLPVHTRLAQQTLLQYNAMQIGVFQLLSQRRAQLDAQLAYVETLREYWSAVTALEALLQGHLVTVSTGTAAPQLPAAMSAGEGHG